MRFPKLCIYIKKTKTDSSTQNLLSIDDYAFVTGSKMWTEDIGTNKNTAAKTQPLAVLKPSRLCKQLSKRAKMQLLTMRARFIYPSLVSKDLVQHLQHTVCTNYHMLKENSTVK